jgi:uncharacterized protein (DUF1697 family)
VPTYLALLRGINVAGHNKLAMPALRELVTALGHTDVRTHLNTGNVVFTARRRGADALAAEIADAITETLGLTVPVQLRTAAELTEIVANGPFAGRTENPAQLLVTFLAEPPDADAVAAARTVAAEAEELTVLGREAYLFCPNGYGRTKLSNAFLERKFRTLATTRNLAVVTALQALAAG